MADPFRPMEPGQIAELIAAYPLAWVVAGGPDGFAASPLPLLPDLDESGHVVRLVGHMARRNRLVCRLEQCPRALILFQGPHGYISPNLVRDRSWGPTWNYAVVQIEADIRFLPEENETALVRLADALERSQDRPWSPAEMGPRFEALSGAIIAFHAHVRRLDARFKLGQDERPEIFQDIVSSLPEGSDLAGWMQRNRAQGS